MTEDSWQEPTVAELFDLQTKTAIVTGGAGYLGRSLTAALAEAGARVVVTATTLERAEQAAARLPDPHQHGHFGIVLNQLDETNISQQFDYLVERLNGQVDVLVNNGHAAIATDWQNVSGAEFTQQLGNATGYFLLARHVRNHAVATGRRASVVMLGSMYGLVASYPTAYENICPASPVAYHTLKGGIAQLTRHLAVYWAADGVRVNCLSPGAFPNGQVSKLLVDRLSERAPLGRIGNPHELKGAIVFLASEASSYMTGHNLVIDGGWTAW